MENNHDYPELPNGQPYNLPSNQPNNLPGKQLTNQAKKHPKTIEELQLWYAYHHLPPEEVTRFFIGKNYTEPKAFGIYKNEYGECVVYKNKASGERAIRYQGPDEAYAVNELLQRLKEEITRQKARHQAKLAGAAGLTTASGSSTPTRSGGSRSGGSRSRSSYNDSDRYSALHTSSFFDKIGSILANWKEWAAGTFFVAAIVALLFGAVNSVPNGYYRYKGTHYYRQGSSWYYYNPSNQNWFRAESLDDYITSENADQYRISNFSGSRFEDSEWYDSGSSWYDDDDDDSYWDDDNDSWDSSDTDWDSDW